MARKTHSYTARLAHWLFAISGVVLGASGAEIFRAFPSLGVAVAWAAGWAERWIGIRPSRGSLRWP